MVEDQIDILKLLQSFALGVIIVGALGSLYLTMRAGGNNKSLLLVLLFLLWVLSPFAALIRINILSGSLPTGKLKSGKAQFDLVQISVLPNNEIPI
jgi:hypothetical protein